MTDYGNWVSKKLLRNILCGLFVLAGLCVLSFLPLAFYASWPTVLLWIIRIVLSGLTIALASVFFIMRRAHKLFSYTDGQVMGKILDHLLGYIQWEGDGQALDIGCGSGALTNRVAKKFPAATVTGVDFWGAGWGYAKEQCEHNAELEGVRQRVTFQKGDAAKLDFPDASFDLAVSNFVFHEVRSQPDKRKVVQEALRVVKPGGRFVFHDLFYNPKLYGDPDEMARELKALGLKEIAIERTSQLPFIPSALRSPIFLRDIGIIYGKK